MNDQLALLCGPGDSSAAMANALAREFGEIPILVEAKEPRPRFLRRRVRRLGLATVAGQVAFAALTPLLRRRGRGRIAAILAESGLDLDRTRLAQADRTASVNDSATVAWLRRRRPKVIVVNGTRIIARRVLEATDAKFINLHCGITPEYRGAHGAYWALSRDDRDGCGVTVHLVDPGTDTGGILAQARIEPDRGDNFATYPWLQLAAGLPLLLGAVRAALAGRVEPVAREAPSNLWYHPTLWHYLATGWRRSVW